VEDATCIETFLSPQDPQQYPALRFKERNQPAFDRALGTGAHAAGSAFMSEPLPWLIESSIKIAWAYLELTGELGDAFYARGFLLKSIDEMIMRGERRKLMLANRAIQAYRDHRRTLAA
jgi:hypothetical protein